MVTEPNVSVLVPLFNCETDVSDCIASLQNQTYRNLEIIAIDDASSDGTLDIVKRIAEEDSRVTPLPLQSNGGPAKALEQGLAKATGPLVARLDADDRAMPDRIRRQVAFLEENPDVAAVGTGAVYEDADGNTVDGPRQAQNHGAIVVRLLLQQSSIHHPSVMMRQEELQRAGGYNADVRLAVDYDLWTRMLMAGRLANIDEPLTRLRVHGGQLSKLRRDIQQSHCNEAHRRLVVELAGLDAVPACIDDLLALTDTSDAMSAERLTAVIDLLFRLVAGMEMHPVFTADDTAAARELLLSYIAAVIERVSDHKARKIVYDVPLSQAIGRVVKRMFGER